MPGKPVLAILKYNGLKTDMEIVKDALYSCEGHEPCSDINMSSVSHILGIFSSTMDRMLALSPQENIYQVICEGLKKLASQAIVIVFSFDHNSGTICLQASACMGSNTFARIISKHPIGVPITISDAVQKSLSTGKYKHITGGLHEITINSFSSPVIEDMHNLLLTCGMYVAGFTWKKQLLGGAAFLIQDNACMLNPVIIEAFVRQISIILKQRQTEKALNESEQKYRDVVQSSNNMIFTSDLEGNVLFANQAFTDNLGYSMAEMKGASCFNFIHSEDQTEMRNKFVSLAKGKIIDNLECRYRRKDGSYINILNSAAPVIDASGDVVSVLGIAYDISDRIKKEKELRDYGSQLEKLVAKRTEELEITNRRLLRELAERKQTEEELRKTSQKLDDLMSLAPVMICRVDLKMNVQYVNKKFEEVTGYAADEVLGKYWPSLGGFTLKDTKAMLKRVIQKLMGRPSRNLQVKVKCKDGRWIYVSGIGELIKENGIPAGIQVMAQDIDEHVISRKEAKRSTRRLLKALEGIVQAMAVTVEMRDPYTAGHQRRVAKLAGMIAREMGLTRDQINGVELAGLIHDLGKIKVPAEILTHPSNLSEAEFNIIKTHPAAGYDILKNIDFPWPVAAAVLQHHERIDGSGYPDGITGEDIIIEAKILAVADVVEAIASHRPYRAALGIDTALAEIAKNKGKLYEPAAVEACISLFKSKGFSLEQL